MSKNPQKSSRAQPRTPPQGPSMRPHAVPGPAGMRIPSGMPMGGGLPQFSPELERALRDAKKAGGQFMIAVFTADTSRPGVDTINFHRTSGEKWSYDWYLRALAMLRNDILSIDLEQPGDGGNDDDEPSGSPVPTPDRPPAPAEAATAEVGELEFDEETQAELAAWERVTE